AENAAFYNYVANLKKVTAPDDTTGVFELSAADPIMTHMWVPILPEHIWKNVSEKDAGTFDNKEMVGTGAFQLVEQSPANSSSSRPTRATGVARPRSTT